MEHVLDPLPGGEEACAPDRFRGVLEMRRAWVLMDLHRFWDARLAFETIRRSWFESLTEADRHEFWFSYGHTLAQLKDVGCNEAFEQAIAGAEHSLRDRSLVERGWQGLLEGLEHTEQWEELEWKSHVCHRDGVRLNSVFLQIISGEYAAKAWRGLGEVQRAADAARKIIARLEAAKVRGTPLLEWQAFLRSVSASA
jgi:hypothetical protein